MIRIEFPKLDVDDIKIFIREEVRVAIDVGLGLDVKQWPQDFGLFELPEGELVVPFPISHVKHPMDDA